MKAKSKIISFTGIGLIVIVIIFFAPITMLSIDGFDGTFETHTSIPFSVQQIGCGISCNEFYVEFFKDDHHNSFWTFGASLDGVMGEEYPKMLFQRNYELKSLVIEHPGNYTVRVSSDDHFIEKKFTVNLLKKMSAYDGIDYYQYTLIQEWLDSCSRSGELSDEQCNAEVRKQIVYSGDDQIQKPYFAVRIPEICLHLDLICPHDYAFPGIEKDGYIVVQFSHDWDDEYYEFVIENNSIKSVHYDETILKENENMESESLQKILEDCRKNVGAHEDGYSLWSNQTHRITPGHCEIRERVNSSISLDRTYAP